MEIFTKAIQYGGPLMTVTMGLFALGIPTTLLLGVLGITRLKVPIFAWLVVPSLLLLTGLAATLHGMLMASKAISFATPDTASILASAGFSYALMTTITGAVMAAILLVLSAWMAACGAIAQPVSGAIASRIPAVLGGGLLLLGGGLTLGGTSILGTPMPGIALVLLTSGPALVLAGLRVSAANASSHAESQLATGLCSVGAVLLVAIATALKGTVGLHDAIANASDDVRAAMMFVSVGLQRQAMVTGPSAVLLALLGSTIASASALRAVPKKRAMGSVGLLGAVLLVASALVWGIQNVFERFKTHWPAYALTNVATDADELPRNETVSGAPGHAELVLEDIQVLQERRGQWLDPARGSLPAALPLPAGLDMPHPNPLLVVSAGRPAVVLSQSQWGVETTALQVLMHSEIPPLAKGNPWLELTSTRALRLSWIPEKPSPPEATRAPEPTGILERTVQEMTIEPVESTLFIIDSNDENLLWQPGSLYSTHRGLDELVSALQAQLASARIERLIFVPGLSWSVQDLVSLCTTAIAAHPAEELDCMLKPAQWLPEVIDSTESGPLGEPEAIGPAVINRVIKRNLTAIRYCYQRALSHDPSLSGEVQITFVVGGDGSVTSAEVQSSGLGSPAVEECVAARFLAFSFPPSPDGSETTFTHPFWFQPTQDP